MRERARSNDEGFCPQSGRSVALGLAFGVGHLLAQLREKIFIQAPDYLIFDYRGIKIWGVFFLFWELLWLSTATREWASKNEDPDTRLPASIDCTNKCYQVPQKWIVQRGMHCFTGGNGMDGLRFGWRAGKCTVGLQGFRIFHTNGMMRLYTWTHVLLFFCMLADPRGRKRFCLFPPI